MKTLALAQPRGAWIDLTTQAWVRVTGRRVSLSEHPWLEGPVGDVEQIGMAFFERFAEQRGWQVVETGTRGLLESFEALRGVSCEPAQVSGEIPRFYERTSEYEFEARAEWSRLFRPFGAALASMFSKRLQQLNLPLSALDTERGMVSRIVRLVDQQGNLQLTAWVREAVATGHTVFAGSYSHCPIPGFSGQCVRVVFPLPNGYALVIMKPESHADGSFTVRSEGRRFGDPGFYFFVQSEPGSGWARYVATLKESIHVFQGQDGVLCADHELLIWGVRFLRLHYRMRRK